MRRVLCCPDAAALVRRYSSATTRLPVIVRRYSSAAARARPVACRSGRADRAADESEARPYTRDLALIVYTRDLALIVYTRDLALIV